MSVSNNFNSMKANMKESYSDNKKKKDRFKRVKTLIQPKGKATAELEASRNPMGFAKKNIEQSLKGKKGVAV